ncbi:hypothetical protein [Sporosarcina sp. FSL K6-1508]|uniref:hypothetical protein n=1 Tax=Sporosarcina sp. FSL K6-1508 TaxID=2921553 RepID=UPI0030F4BFF7
MELSDIIRVGIVDGANDQEGTVRVMFPDKDDQVVPDIPLMCHEQNYPRIGESALCLFLPNGTEQGFCLGGYYHDENPPPIKDKEIYVKKLDDDLSIKYDYRIKELTIENAKDVVINGNLLVKGTIKSG